MSTLDPVGTAEAFDRMVRGIALPEKRIPQARRDTKLPKDTIVVSADNHWSMTEDIFYERFPAHLKERAPRFLPNKEGTHIYMHVGGKPALREAQQKIIDHFADGNVSIESRLRDLDVEGIEKEIVFGNAIAFFLGYPDLEVREWVFRIYNEHLAEIARKAPGRFHGVGLVNYWDMSKVRESIAEVKALGLKAYQLPVLPKKENGQPMDYCLPEMDPLWAAVEEGGLPFCFHVGESVTDGWGMVGTMVMQSFAPFRKSLGEMIFGGILDRHPNIRVIFTEAEINWIPGALQTASMIYDCYSFVLKPQIKHHPRHYWHNNCYATFMHDPAGLRLLDIIGADRVMWSSDYPHLESTLGFTWSAMESVIDVATEDEARMILGGTAMKVFNLQ
jgi:predicted TIM-barrel fold metal-dependent hydrolase